MTIGGPFDAIPDFDAIMNVMNQPTIADDNKMNSDIDLPSGFSTEDCDRIRKIKDRANHLNISSKTRQNLEVVIAGGSFTSWYYSQTPKDVDVFILRSNAYLFADLSLQITRGVGAR